MTPLELSQLYKKLNEKVTQLETRESGFSLLEARIREQNEMIGHLRTQIIDLENKYRAMNARMGKKHETV